MVSLDMQDFMQLGASTSDKEQLFLQVKKKINK